MPYWRKGKVDSSLRSEWHARTLLLQRSIKPIRFASLTPGPFEAQGTVGRPGEGYGLTAALAGGVEEAVPVTMEAVLMVSSLGHLAAMYFSPCFSMGS